MLLVTTTRAAFEVDADQLAVDGSEIFFLKGDLCVGQASLADLVHVDLTGGPAEFIAAMRAAHPNAYSPWTKVDDRDLIGLTRAGFGNRKISRLLGRSPGAIRSRMDKLELLD